MAGIVDAEIVAVPAQHALDIGEHVFLDGLVERAARLIGNVDTIARQHQTPGLGCHRADSWMGKQFARLGFKRQLFGRDERGRKQTLGHGRYWLW